MIVVRSYSSGGLCSSNSYRYGKVAAVLSVLLTFSTLVLLSISLSNVNTVGQVGGREKVLG